MLIWLARELARDAGRIDEYNQRLKRA